jgi:hypothetical protein
MLIVGSVVLGIAIFFAVILLTIILGGVSRKDDKRCLRETAEDLAARSGGVTPPTYPEDRYINTLG